MSRWNSYIRHRIGWGENLRPFLEKPLPGKPDWTLTLGGALALLFVVEAVTGMILAMYYNPSPEHAYQSIHYIMNDVFLGRILRGIHHWGGGAMIVLVVLHLLATFFYGAYKAPREFTWIAGVFLLVITLGFGFTGYLLPWDQKAYWATVVGTSVASDVPIIGSLITRLLRGGAEVSGLTLTRFYAVHMLIFPALTVLFMAIHIYLVRVHDIAGHWQEERGVQPETARFYPDQVFRSAVAFFIVFIGITLMAVFIDPPLEQIAMTPDPSYIPRPDWYFMWLYKMLTFFSGKMEVIGTLAIPIGGMLILLLLPFFNKSPLRSPHERPLAMAFGAACLVGIVYMNIMGMADSSPYGQIVVVPDRPLSALEAAGVKRWVEKDCAYCHHVQGRGGHRGQGPDLANVIAKHRSQDWIKKSIRDPLSVSRWNTMPKYDNTEEELLALSAYILSLDFQRDGLKTILREAVVADKIQ
jgi:quinol-cytochrome oxidoreductase complex cytochrome b subunit